MMHHDIMHLRTQTPGTGLGRHPLSLWVPVSTWDLTDSLGHSSHPPTPGKRPELLDCLIGRKHLSASTPVSPRAQWTTPPAESAAPSPGIPVEIWGETDSAGDNFCEAAVWALLCAKSIYSVGFAMYQKLASTGKYTLFPRRLTKTNTHTLTK